MENQSLKGQQNF